MLPVHSPGKGTSSQEAAVEAVIEAIERHRERSVGILRDFLRIPSISSDSRRKEDVRKAAEYLADVFRGQGIESVEIIPTDGHPVVYAEWLGAPGAPTLLVYGHYDVQPIADEKEWITPPFEPHVENGKIRARGSTDDKGQLLVHVLAAGAHLSTNGALPMNVKFLIEGEEEIGSAHLETFVKANRERLACDAIAISDTHMYAPGIPSIATGLRGIAYVEFTLRGAKADLHSGGFGGAVDNPAIALPRLLAGLKDEKTGKILIDGFYDNVLPVSDAERAEWAKLPEPDRRFLEASGASVLYGEEGYGVLERVGARPSLDVNGVWGGFTGEGSMTVLPARASAKVSMRLVPNQTPDEAARKLKRHLEAHLPETMTLERFEDLHGGMPWTCSLDNPVVQSAFRAVERAFGKAPVPLREGGSIPIVQMFADELKVPVVLMGFGLPDEAPHGPNENFDLGNFDLGIRSAAYYLEELAGALTGGASPA
jgi:acetylornithine deacetylase/succinyl-diaminopimelate desuccinylase-like protein